MPDVIEFIVYGKPKAQKRHRTFTKDKHGRRLPFPIKLDPSKDDKASLLAQVMQHRPDAPWTGPIEMRIKWVMPRPKSHYRTGAHAGELRPDSPLYCTSHRRSDSDNLEKLVADALDGVFYLDDCQIAAVHKVKVYDTTLPETPRTEITLRKLEDTHAGH